MGRCLRRWLSLAILGFFLVSCANPPAPASAPATASAQSPTTVAALATAPPRPTGASPTATPTAAPPPQVIVTRDDPHSPPGCTPREVADLLLRFFDAFNRGDQPELARFFAPEFEWYSVTDRGNHFMTANRDALLAYFARRHQQHERLELRMLDVHAGGGRADIIYALAHRADDLPPALGDREWSASGKGTVSCPGQRIGAWSMGTRDTPDRVPCPDPPPGTPPNAVIVCGRE